MLKRLVVVGAAGYLGRRIAEHAERLVPVLRTSSRESKGVRLDLLHARAFSYSQLIPGDVVVLSAGISEPDACANHREHAWALNVEGTVLFMQHALSRGVRIIFLSSDTVYGERNAEFDETATCDPVGDYAAMKYAVEQRFTGNPQVKALRLSYAFSAEDRFTRYLQACAAGQVLAEIYHPFLRATVHRDDVAAAACALAQRWDEFDESAINVGGPEIVSRLDCARLLRELALPQLSFGAVEPEANFFHNRPRVIRMKSPHLEALLGRPARTLREAVKREFGTV